MNMKKQSNKKKEAEGVIDELGNKVGKFTKEYATQGNILKALGIVGALGTAAFLAVRFVPWDKVMDTLEENLQRLEESFNDTFNKVEAPSE
jgi:hypothetical protein